MFWFDKQLSRSVCFPSLHATHLSLYNIWLLHSPAPNWKYDHRPKTSDQIWGRIASPQSQLEWYMPLLTHAPFSAPRYVDVKYFACALKLVHTADTDEIKISCLLLSTSAVVWTGYKSVTEIWSFNEPDNLTAKCDVIWKLNWAETR